MAELKRDEGRDGGASDLPGASEARLRALEARLAAQEERLAEMARRAAERTDLLLRFTVATGLATSEEEVAQVFARELSSLVRAETGAVMRLSADGRSLLHLAGCGGGPADPEAPSVPLEAPTALCEAVRRREVIDVPPGAEALRAFPGAAEVLAGRPRGALAIPMISPGGEVIGGIALLLESGAPLDADERQLALALAGQCALALERARLHQAEERARAESELRAERMRRLQAVAARLSRALSAPEVAQIVIDEGTEAIGALTGAIWARELDDRLTLLRSRSYVEGAYQVLPLDHSSPIGACVLRAEPIWLESREEYATRFPAFEAGAAYVEPHDQPGRLAVACLPLVIEDRAIGGLAFSFDQAREFHADERAFLMALAQHCAQGLERARLYDLERAARREAELARERASFLADASLVLSSSLDMDEMLPRIAELAVPTIGDWCAIDLVHEERRQLVLSALCYADRWLVDRVIDQRRRNPVDLDRSPSLAARVVREGAPVLLEEVGDDQLVASAASPEHLQLLRELQLKSVMVVPVEARDQVFGSITFAACAPRGPYGADDLDMARQLGHRVGMAVDNARLYRQAVQAVSIRDEFLSIAGHELRTPLTPILLESQVLARLSAEQAGEASEVSGARIERIRARADKLRCNAERLGKLIDELLDVSRISGGRLRLELDDVDLAAVVEEVVRRNEEQAAREETALEVDLDGPVRGRWDRVRLEQVVSNLLGNAIKYGRGKPVRLSARAEGGRAILTVRDRGIGIAPESHERIFQRFERAVSSRHFGGLGLGLWIVRQIVDAHGGSVRVDSRPGDGATFTVELPLAPAPG